MNGTNAHNLTGRAKTAGGVVVKTLVCHLYSGKLRVQISFLDARRRSFSLSSLFPICKKHLKVSRSGGGGLRFPYLRVWSHLWMEDLCQPTMKVELLSTLFIIFIVQQLTSSKTHHADLLHSHLKNVLRFASNKYLAFSSHDRLYTKARLVYYTHTYMIIILKDTRTYKKRRDINIIATLIHLNGGILYIVQNFTKKLGRGKAVDEIILGYLLKVHSIV